MVSWFQYTHIFPQIILKVYLAIKLIHNIFVL